MKNATTLYLNAVVNIRRSITAGYAEYCAKKYPIHGAKPVSRDRFVNAMLETKNIMSALVRSDVKTDMSGFAYPLPEYMFAQFEYFEYVTDAIFQNYYTTLYDNNISDECKDEFKVRMEEILGRFMRAEENIIGEKNIKFIENKLMSA